MRVELKSTFDAIGTRPECFWGILVLMGVLDEMGFPMVTVSGNDGRHGYKSQHYAGFGFDIRARDPGGNWEISDPEGKQIVDHFNDRCGHNPDHELMYEPDEFDASGNQTKWKHLHFEYQRKRPEG